MPLVLDTQCAAYTENQGPPHAPSLTIERLSKLKHMSTSLSETFQSQYSLLEKMGLTNTPRRKTASSYD